MRKIIVLIFFSLIFSFSLFSESNFIIAVQRDGSEIKVYLNKNVKEKSFFLSDNDSTNTHTINFKGFDAVGELDYIDCFTLPYLENYDFLAEVKSCKSIYLGYAHYFDFNILKNVKNLEEIDFEGFISEEDFQEIKRNGIDVSELKYLKKLIFNPAGYKIDFDLKIKYAEDVSE